MDLVSTTCVNQLMCHTLNLCKRDLVALRSILQNRSVLFFVNTINILLHALQIFITINILLHALRKCITNAANFIRQMIIGGISEVSLNYALNCRVKSRWLCLSVFIMLKHFYLFQQKSQATESKWICLESKQQ